MASSSAARPLVSICAALSGGIAADRYLAGAVWWFPSNIGWQSGLASVALMIWLIAYRLGRDGWANVFLLFAVFQTGAAWHHDRWSLFDLDDLGRFVTDVPQPVCVRAQLCAPPHMRPAGEPHPLASFRLGSESELEVQVEQIRDGLRWRSASGRTRVRVIGECRGLRRHDRLQIWGMCERPRPCANPGEYDVAGAERGQRCLARLHVKSVEAIRRLDRAIPWTPLHALDALRQRSRARLQDLVGPRHATLAAALLLGDREQLPEQQRHGFFVTGLAHLLAISGLNVAIFSYGFWLVARLGWAPRRLSLIVAMFLALFYAAFTDGQPPVVRAAILVVVLCLARWTGRVSPAWNTLAAAAILVLVLNPVHLFQTGAQLSFLAVAVLMSRRATCSVELDPLDRLLQRHQPWWRKAGRIMRGQLQGIMTLNLQVWAISLPLVICRFHLVSLISVVLNPLVVLPTTVALYAGFGCLVVGRDPWGIGCFFGWLTDWSLTGLMRMIDWGERIPSGHFWTAAPPTWWLVIYFLGLAILGCFLRRLLPTRWNWVAWIWWMLLGSVWIQRTAATVPSGNEELECTFVSVGHGTSVIVRLPGGGTLLYDCGRLGWPPTAARATAGVLWEQAVDHLDAVVLSHADTDHYNGLPDLLQRFSVGVIYVSPMMFEHASQPLLRLRQAIRQAGVACREIEVGDRLLARDDVAIEVLHPPPVADSGSDNSKSVVLLIEYRGYRLLLPGDLESPGLELLLATNPLPCDLVMAPHHGSARSDPAAFLRWSQPKHVVVSGAGGRNCEAIESAATAVGAGFWHTARHGAVTVSIGSRGVQVRSFRPATGTY